MSTPPPPGQWGGQPPPPPGYYPQQFGWAGPPPPKQNNTVKWLLAGVGVLLVIAITVGVTVLVTRDGSGGAGPTSTSAAPPIASADDTGPIEIITLEPTCQAWMPVSRAMTQVQQNGWGDRDSAVPASQWTPEQLSQYEAVAKSLRQSADQAAEFARQTPNRVVRELYEQFIAFSRAYADSVPSYTAADNYFAFASVAASYSLDSLCNAINYGAAGAISSDVAPIDSPASEPPLANPTDPPRFLNSSDSACPEIVKQNNQFVADTREWAQQDPNISAADWTADRRQAANSVVPVMERYAAEMERLGEGSTNAVLQDLAYFVAVYLRGYVRALPSYDSADNYLVIAATRTANLITAACESARS